MVVAERKGFKIGSEEMAMYKKSLMIGDNEIAINIADLICNV